MAGIRTAALNFVGVPLRGVKNAVDRTAKWCADEQVTLLGARNERQVIGGFGLAMLPRR